MKNILNRNLAYRLLAIVIVTALSTYYTFYKKPKLGLDLKGGVSILLEAEENKDSTLDDKALDRLVDTIERRINFLGVAEPNIQVVGTKKVLVEIPGVENEEEAVSIIGKTALLEFKIVKRDGTLGETLMTGSSIKRADVAFDNMGLPYVAFELTAEGSKTFYEITKNNVNKKLAIVLDGETQSSPTINGAIAGGKASITSDSYSYEEARKMVLLLNAGALPVKVTIAEIKKVSATLGNELINSSFKAGILASLLVSGFMIFWYFFAGLVATLALAIFGLMVFGIMNFIDATFTLPGIAGLILSLGMAVDANVIIFEMIKEELRKGNSVLGAINLGFKKAYSSILDSNITTLIITFILFILGTGPIRGYSITLGLGIFASMFTAIFVTRVLLMLLVDMFKIKSIRNFGFEGINIIKFNLSKYSTLFLSISGLFIILSIFYMFTKGFNYGVDFTGGNLFNIKFEGVIDQAKFSKTISSFKDKNIKAHIQFADDQDNKRNIAIIKTAELKKETKSELLNHIKNQYGNFKVQKEELIGATVGKSLKTNSLIALIIGAILIAIYISIRFEATFALGAIIALAHDILIAMGIISFLGYEINTPFIVAILTILGYSINDTVVVFDRIRENRKKSKSTLTEVIDRSIREVFTRSMNTSVTTFLALLALIIFSENSLKTFLTTFLVGIIAGTYSSLFVASPIVRLLNKSEKDHA